jgi:hypothetical protein
MGEVIDIRPKAAPARPRPLCTARKKNGDSCSNKARAGSDKCGSHSGNSGRKLALTDEKRKTLLEALRAGLWRRDAAIFAGVGESTLQAYLAAGSKGREANTENEFTELLDAVEAAQIGVKVLASGTIIKAIQEGNAEMALKFLERQFPGEWGKRDAKLVEHAGSVGVEALLGGRQPVDVPREKRERIIAILEEDDEDTTDGTATEIDR